MDPADTPRIATIILLHGTWGRGVFPEHKDIGSCRNDAPGTRWFERGSAFRSQLEASLGTRPPECSIRWFSWSGANSVFERARAATKLAEELEADLKDPRTVPVIVAHSHGGNVALRAVSQIDHGGRVKVVTMATPFLRVFARDSFDMSLLVWWLLFSAITTLLFTALMFPVLFVVTRLGYLDGRLGPVFAIVGLVALAAGVFLTRRIESKFVNPSDSSSGQPRRSQRIQQAADYKRVDASGPAMLVIRGVDDEAALSLAAGAIGSGLARRLVFAILPAVLTPLTLLWMLLGDRADSFMPFVFTGIAVASPLFLFLAALCKATFGREFMGAAFLCDIAADSTPDASAKIDSVTLSPVVAAGARFRHSIYEHPDCAKQVAGWIGEVV